MMSKDLYVVETCKACGTPSAMGSIVNGKEVALRVLCDCRRIELEEAEEIAQIERIKDRRKACFSNANYRDYRFERDDGKDPSTTKALVNYVKNFSEVRPTGRGLLLWGHVGTGKTFGAACIANALIEKGVRVKQTTLTEIIQNAQDWDNAAEHFDRMLRNDVIMLDDFGTQRGSGFATEQTYSFINECNIRNICLIVTTNLTLNELVSAAECTQDLTHARICSRILEKCYPVKVNSVKRRKINQTENTKKMEELLND